jgi:hypothetical protein
MGRRKKEEIKKRFKEEKLTMFITPVYNLRAPHQKLPIPVTVTHSINYSINTKGN